MVQSLLEVRINGHWTAKGSIGSDGFLAFDPPSCLGHALGAFFVLTMRLRARLFGDRQEVRDSAKPLVDLRPNAADTTIRIDILLPPRNAAKAGLFKPRPAVPDQMTSDLLRHFVGSIVDSEISFRPMQDLRMKLPSNSSPHNACVQTVSRSAVDSRLLECCSGKADLLLCLDLRCWAVSARARPQALRQAGLTGRSTLHRESELTNSTSWRNKVSKMRKGISPSALPAVNQWTSETVACA